MNTLRPVTPTVASLEIDILPARSSGNVRVLITRLPPVLSPGMGAMKVFLISNWLTILLGNRSRGTVRLEGSVLGRVAPLRVVVTYLPPSPRINTNLPSCTVTLGRRITAAATSVSPKRARSSIPSVSTTLTVSRSTSSMPSGR